MNVSKKGGRSSKRQVLAIAMSPSPEPDTVIGIINYIPANLFKKIPLIYCNLVRGSPFAVRRAHGAGFGVRGLAFGVRNFAFGVRNFAFGVLGSGSGVRGSGFGVRGSAFGVWRLAFAGRWRHTTLQNFARLSAPLWRIPVQGLGFVVGFGIRSAQPQSARDQPDAILKSISNFVPSAPLW
jgi:hypothetical protein